MQQLMSLELSWPLKLQRLLRSVSRHFSPIPLEGIAHLINDALEKLENTDLANNAAVTLAAEADAETYTVTAALGIPHYLFHIEQTAHRTPRPGQTVTGVRVQTTLHTFEFYFSQEGMLNWYLDKELLSAESLGTGQQYAAQQVRFILEKATVALTERNLDKYQEVRRFLVEKKFKPPPPSP